MADSEESDESLRARIANKYGRWGAFLALFALALITEVVS